MSKLRIAVFISGGGQTLQNLIHCSETTHVNIFEVVQVGADRYCKGLKFAGDLPTQICRNPTYIQSWLCQHNADFVCLAGYLSKFSITWGLEGKVLNIHPSLIPKYCGAGWYGTKVHEEVIKAGEKESGCTVHFCDNEFDHGPILLQNRLAVDPSWDATELSKAVFELEKKTYPAALALLYNSNKRRTAMGKGDKRRPIQCSAEQYEANFESVFGKTPHWWETKEHDDWLKEAAKIKEETDNECESRK